MKLPSMQKIAVESRNTMRRFPIALLCAVLSTIIAILLIDYEDPSRNKILYNILFAATLGIPMMIIIALIAEKRTWSRTWFYGAQIIGLLALAVYAATIPADIPGAPLIYLYRHLMLVLGFVLLIMFAPYFGSSQQNGFWQFNKTLFYRILTTGLYAMVLFMGLSIALAALDKLFGIDIPEKRYAELWMAIVGLFAPLFFLSGIPEDLNALEANSDYPKGLRVFAQYILAPLVMVYLIILYAYITKIIIQWSWPQGWVSRLILSFSATGIFSLALLYPIRERAENRWITSAIRWFWIVILPLVIVLLMAIWQRISDYGITENRYIGIVLALWLAAMSLYFNLSKTKGLKIIPASLCLLAIATSFGPWGMFSVSEHSQANHFRNLLGSNSLLLDNKVRSSSDTVSVDDARQISSIISYLYETHGYGRIQPLFNESLTFDSAGSADRRKVPDEVAKMIGIEYRTAPRNFGDKEVEFSANRHSTIAVTRYQRLMPGQYVGSDTRGYSFTEEGIAYHVDSSLWVMTFTGGLDSVVAESLEVDLHPLIDTLIAEYGAGGGENIPLEKMTLAVSGKMLKVGVCLKRIHLQRKNDVLSPAYYTADILYSIGD